MTSQKRNTRGLLSVGGLALLLAVPGGALAQSSPPPTGSSQTQGTGTSPPGTVPQPTTVPPPASGSTGLTEDDLGPSPLLGEDREPTGLYGGATGDGGVDLGVGGSGEAPESLVPTPSTDTNGVLNPAGSSGTNGTQTGSSGTGDTGTGGTGTAGSGTTPGSSSQIPGMDRTTPPDVQMPDVPTTNDSMGQPQGGQ